MLVVTFQFPIKVRFSAKYAFVSPSVVISWWRGTVVERRSLAGELSLSCARPVTDG